MKPLSAEDWEKINALGFVPYDYKAWLLENGSGSMDFSDYTIDSDLIRLSELLDNVVVLNDPPADLWAFGEEGTSTSAIWCFSESGDGLVYTWDLDTDEVVTTGMRFPEFITRVMTKMDSCDEDE